MFPFCATKNSLEETGLALTAVLGHRMVLQQKQKKQLSHGTVFLRERNMQNQFSFLGTFGLTCPGETAHQVSGSGVCSHTAHGLCNMQMQIVFICHTGPCCLPTKNMRIGLCFLACGTASDVLLH